MPRREKIIRDPVHDVIAFHLQRPLDGLLFHLINSAEFQRLRRVHQLGLANLAYPGADHSRYSHCLGVMETARKIIVQLRHSFAIDEQDETLCITAALLHDLGHGPFSHVFERVSGIRHELLTQRIIRDPDSQVHRILFRHDRFLPEKLIEFLNGRPQRTFLNDIIASQLDADRFDYLLRDSLMTGSGYGSFDLQWLLHALTIDESSNRLAVTWKGVSAVEAYLQARFHMYRNVYFHKVVRSAEGMVKLALQRARLLAAQDRLPGEREGYVRKALLGQRLTMEEFVDLDDVSILSCIKEWCRSTDPLLASLSRGLTHRRLFKTIDLSHHSAALAGCARVAAAGAIEAAGGDANYELFYDEPTRASYESTATADSSAEDEILVLDARGALKSLAQVSPMTKALSRQLMFRRLHVSPGWYTTVKEAIESAEQNQVNDVTAS